MQATITDMFHLSFSDTMLDANFGLIHWVNHIQIAPEDRDKTAFVTKWGVITGNVMTFSLKNAPPTFQ